MEFKTRTLHYRDRLAVSRIGAVRVDGRNLVRETHNRQYVSSGFFSHFSEGELIPETTGITHGKKVLNLP